MISPHTARKLATAFFEVCQESRQLEEGFAYLKRLVQIIEGVPQLVELQENPKITRREKESFMEPLFRGEPLIFKGWITLLIKRGGFDALPTICRIYKELWDEEKKLITITVRTPMPLGEDQKRTITQLAESKMGGSCALVEEIDKEMMGGIVLQMGSWVYDASFTHFIEELSSHLKEIQYGRRL